MYTAKIYRVRIGSSGVPMEEERIAFDTISQWNELHGEEMGTVFLSMSVHDVSSPDLYVFAIDNYVDSRKIKSLLDREATVLLLFKKHHDPDNTILGEVKDVDAFRIAVQSQCVCEDYNEVEDFPHALLRTIDKIILCGI